MAISQIHTSRNTTAKKAYFVQRSLWVNLCNTNIMHNCVLAKCWGSHEVIDRLSIYQETALAVIHHDTSTSGTPNLTTEVSLSRLAKLALSAFCLVTRDDMITWLNLGHTFTNTLHNPESQNIRINNKGSKQLLPNIRHHRQQKMWCEINSVNTQQPHDLGYRGRDLQDPTKENQAGFRLTAQKIKAPKKSVKI